MAEENKLIEIVDELSKNAMFRLSLCSKELFHSNFWAWLIEQEPKFVSMFGEEFSNIETKVDIKREDKICTVEEKDIFNENKTYKKNCIADISFIHNNNLYIVENKLKSLPNKEQLENYIVGDIINEKYKNLQRKVILTSFTKPIFELNINIKYVSYKDICDKLKNLKYLFNSNNENKILLENYIKYLDLMNQLNDNLSLKNSESMTYGVLLDKIEKAQEKLESLHFDTFVKNLMYCHLVSDLLEECKYKENLFTCVTYSSKAKHSYMDIMYTYYKRTADEINKYRKSDEQEFKVFIAGIQIAGNEYRKYFNVVKKIKEKNDKTKNNLTASLYNNFAEFIDKTNDNDLNCNRKNNNGFYCYDYEEDAWLYRKTNVDIRKMKFQDLKEKIVEDLNYLNDNK